MKRILALLLVVALVSCKKGSGDSNKPPKSFTVSVTDVKATSAQLNWTAAVDPENQAVSYSIELKGMVVASNISATTFKLENLTENMSYTGKIIAKDAAGLTTEASYSFATGNSPTPSAFTITLQKATYKDIEIIWSPSTLPDNGTVTYDVYVNNTFRAGSIPTLNYLITGLQPQTQYTIKVIAKSAAGKSTESTIQLSTTVNQAPGSFTITKSADGVTTITIDGNKPIDPEQEQLNYFTVIDNVKSPIFLSGGSPTTFTYRIQGLTGGQQYAIAVRVEDPGGASSTSNTITVTTFKSPENNFAIAPVAEGSKVAIEFDTQSEERINAANSEYLVGDDWKSLAAAQITYTALPNGKTRVKILLDDADLRTRYNVKLQLRLRWTPEEITTTSILVYYTHFTATTAVVSAAHIQGPGAFPPQWTINFINCVISDYSTWDIQTIMFDNVEFTTFAGFAICNPSITGYYTGNATVAQYNYLKTKTTGYVIVKDAGGYHKLNFTYTWQD